MSVESPEYQALQEAATKQPIKVINGLVDMNGPDQGGLTLSREHIVTLNLYANHVLTLPTEQAAVIAELGYSSIAEPALAPSSMAELFVQLRTHGLSWRPLSDNSKHLASQLSVTADAIETAGDAILDACKGIGAVGANEKLWDVIVLNEPLALNTSDQAAVRGLADIFDILLKDVRDYARRVAEVTAETKTFRDIAALELIPAVHDKRRAVLRERSSDEVKDLREQLAELDANIKALNSEYDQYVKAALSGLAAGPIGVAITGGIYGSKAERVRKQRNQAQAERRGVCDQLKSRIRLEGSLEALSGVVEELKTRLQEVVVASSHLHTAWGSVEAYIVQSVQKLDSISNTRQLLRFVIYFKQFLRQWAEIKRKSSQLTRIFDEASAA